MAAGSAWHDVGGATPDAPALLLVHGLGVTAGLTWRASIPALARHFRVLHFDLPGHGEGRRPERFRLEACADDAVRILDELGLERAVVAGYSLGGSIATLTWRHHPARVTGLVLAATSAAFARGRRQRILKALAPVAQLLLATRPERLRERLVERAIERLDGHESAERVAAQLEGHHLPTVLAAARAAGNYSALPWLHEIDVPVSVVVTADDDRISASRQRELAAAIPTAKRFEVPGPHTACATRPESFVPGFVDACRDVQERARGAAPAMPVA